MRPSKRADWWLDLGLFALALAAALAFCIWAANLLKASFGVWE